MGTTNSIDINIFHKKPNDAGNSSYTYYLTPLSSSENIIYKWDGKIENPLHTINLNNYCPSTLRFDDICGTYDVSIYYTDSTGTKVNVANFTISDTDTNKNTYFIITDTNGAVVNVISNKGNVYVEINGKRISYEKLINRSSSEGLADSSWWVFLIIIVLFIVLIYLSAGRNGIDRLLCSIQDECRTCVY